jgi:hypothetical protein
MPNPVIIRRLALGSILDPIWQGLNAYWKLEEATGAIRVDSTGNGNHLTDMGANITQVSGIIGNAASSAGGSSCLEVGDSAFVGAGPGVSFSLSIWIKSSGTANAAIAGKWASTDNIGGQPVQDWLISLNGGNNLVLNLHGPGYHDTGILYGGVLNNTWQHLCLTFQAGTHVCNRYLNGSFAGSTTEIADVQRGTGSFALFNFGVVHAAGVVGSLDEAGLWNRALSADEAAHLYNGGLGLAYPGNALPPTMAQKWALQVMLNGGAAPSQSTITALDMFWNGLQMDGLDTKIIVLNAFVPDSLIAAITPFVVGVGINPWTNHNFVAGDLTVNGLTGNGTNKYLETGILSSTLGANLGMVSYAAVVSPVGFDFGAFDAARDFFIASKYSDNKSYFSSGEVRGVVGVNPTSPGAGFYSCQRTSNTSMAAYFASSGSPFAQIGATDVAASPGYPTQTLYSLALQQNTGGPQLWSSATISFQAITNGLSSADTQKLFNRVQTLRTALGGGFV